MGLPAKVTAAYWPNWFGSHRLADVHSSYNVIFLAFVTGEGGATGTGGTGRVTISTGNNLVADIAAKRAAGVQIIPSVGGETGYIHLDTTARRDAFWQSVQDLYVTLGGFDGWDWNFETNWGAFSQFSITGAVLDNIIWICQQMKATWGSGFTISKPPHPSVQHDRDWMTAMHAAGVIDWIMPQYYDTAHTNAGILSNSLSWINEFGADRFGFGFRTRQSYTNSGGNPDHGRSYADIESILSTRLGTHPTLRGAFVWESRNDSLESWWFGTNVSTFLGSVVAPPADWAEPVGFSGINAVSYDDLTVEEGDWYRYRVAASEGGALITGFTDWVQAQAPAGGEPPPPPPPPPDSRFRVMVGGSLRPVKIKVGGQLVDLV